MKVIKNILFIFLLSTFLFLPLISASIITDSHGISPSTPQPSDTEKSGARILANKASTFIGVTISPFSTATTAYLVEDDAGNCGSGTILASAPINSYFANFSSQEISLSSGTQYWIAIDSNGSSYSQGNGYEPSPSFAYQNISGTNIDWTYGCTNEGNANANHISGIVSIKTFTSGTYENLNITQNLTVGNTGFFAKLGSALSRIFMGWFNNIDVSGNATISQRLIVGYEQNTNVCTEGTQCTATCSSGKQIIGGGCSAPYNLLNGNSASSLTDWTCTAIYPTLSNITAKAICARVY